MPHDQREEVAQTLHKAVKALGMLRAELEGGPPVSQSAQIARVEEAQSALSALALCLTREPSNPEMEG